MHWVKLGKIFDPTEYKFPNNRYEFAQSPQVLVFDDFIRIYFSSRTKDPKNNKYLSHILFIDMDKDFKEIIQFSDKVIELGKIGCFDEHGIFPMNVLQHENKIFAYTSGWNRKVSVSVDTSIGLALSYDNGLTFNKVGDGPILTSSLDEPFLVGDPFVKVYENVFHMWYIYGTEWRVFQKDGVPERIYKIGHATSSDGVNWSKDGRQIISDKFINESQALPTVIHFQNKYHMFFCYRQSLDFRTNKDRSYRIGYAFSHDMVNWVRDDEKAGIDVTPGSWDSDMMCYPHVFHCDGKVYMLYNGNEFGRYGFGLARLKDEL